MPFAFKNPEFFISLLLLLPLLVWYYLRYQVKRSATVKFSSLSAINKIPPSPLIRFRHLIFILRLLALVSIVSALARPQTGKKNTIVRSEGIDIMLSLDISGSMRAEDIQPVHRLNAAKKITADFIKMRHSDRVGLVLFGSEAFLQCPMTLDHGVLIDFLSQVDFIEELENATAIGMAVSHSILALKNSTAKSKIIVLLTDGDNNAGDIDPFTASALAATFDIKIYTIGIGKPGVSQVFITQRDMFGSRKVPMQNTMNESTLIRMAEQTGGRYFNAQDAEALSHTYKEIDRLERSEILSKQYMEYNEIFLYFIAAAAIFFFLEILLNSTRFRKIP